jgi:hypothetical protein
MEKYSDKYKNFLHENLEDKFKDKLDMKYNTLKRGILLLLENSVDDVDELVNVQNYINKSSTDLENNPLIGFVDDGDIYDFYLKYQADIDEICDNNSWFNKTPKEENIFSLYQYIISGAKFGVKMCLIILEKELF